VHHNINTIQQATSSSQSTIISLMGSNAAAAIESETANANATAVSVKEEESSADAIDNIIIDMKSAGDIEGDEAAAVAASAPMPMTDDKSEEEKKDDGEFESMSFARGAKNDKARERKRIEPFLDLSIPVAEGTR